MTITLRAGVLNSGIQQNGTEFLTVDTSNNATLSNNLTVTGAVSGTTGTFTGAVSGTTGTFTGAVTTPLSYVRLNTANGYGSTNNKIRRFTTTVNSAGVDITYADSATLGGTFTINTAGVYSVSYCDQFTAAATMGLSIDSTQLTTNIQSVTAVNVLSMCTTTGGNVAEVASATFYAAAASVVRAHTDGVAAGITSGGTQFTIARVQ